jgi:surface protein
MRLTDGKKLVDIKIQHWNGSGYDPDWSADYFNAGSLEYDERLQAYKVDDVSYCVDMARDRISEEGACHGDENMTVTVDEYELSALSPDLSTVIRNPNVMSGSLEVGFPAAAKQIIFTDQPAPAGAETRDMSEAQDGGVVGWMQGDTFYVSTQRPGVKVTAPVDCSHLFAFTAAESMDVTMLDTSNTTKMDFAFDGCISLANLAGLASWIVNRVVTTSCMFQDCWRLTNIDGLSQWDVSNVTCMDGMFFYCSSLTNVDALANWDVASVTDLAYMFRNCTYLANINGLAGWDTSHVTDMNGTFRNCASLTSLDGLVHWDTSHVTNMCSLFHGCVKLETVDALAGWDTHNVQYLNNTFHGCKSLASIDPLANWDISNVIRISYMFDYCKSLASIDALSSWNFRDDMEGLGRIFYNCDHSLNEAFNEFCFRRSSESVLHDSTQQVTFTDQPYIPKVEAAGKVPDAEPER